MEFTNIFIQKIHETVLNKQNNREKKVGKFFICYRESFQKFVFEIQTVSKQSSGLQPIATYATNGSIIIRIQNIHSGTTSNIHPQTSDHLVNLMIGA